jgi:nucleotide-binding universal stress UspA family protein
VTDLYIWISENRAALEKELGWEIRSDIAATSLILERGAQSEPGSWRKARTSARYTDQLFNDILVPLSGNDASWSSVEQALLIAKRENASLHGLHVVDTKEKIHSPNALAVQTRFHEMCAQEGVNGKLVIEAGDITRKINERAAMTDLIVLKIEHPPLGGLSSFTSPFRAIVANSASPMLGVPEQVSQIKRALLAYDGSDHAKEVLFVATYFAEVWKTELLVFTAVDQSVKADIQDYVRRYLDIHEVQAEYIISEHGAMDYLKQTVHERNVDILMMGSHGGSLLQQVISGSALDYMLRESKVPMFICR